MDVELVPIVDEMHGEGREFERQRVGVGFCPMCAVDVSSNGADWCEFTKAFEYRWRPDVACVQDVPAALERIQCRGPK